MIYLWDGGSSCKLTADVKDQHKLVAFVSRALYYAKEGLKKLLPLSDYHIVENSQYDDNLPALLQVETLHPNKRSPYDMLCN